MSYELSARRDRDDAICVYLHRDNIIMKMPLEHDTLSFYAARVFSWIDDRDPWPPFLLRPRPVDNGLNPPQQSTVTSI